VGKKDWKFPMTQIDDILEIIAAKAMIDRAKLTPEVKLNTLGLTSLDMVELVFAIEDKFGIEMPFNANTGAHAFQTIGDVIAAVEGKTPSKGA